MTTNAQPVVIKRELADANAGVAGAAQEPAKKAAKAAADKRSECTHTVAVPTDWQAAHHLEEATYGTQVRAQMTMQFAALHCSVAMQCLRCCAMLSAPALCVVVSASHRSSCVRLRSAHLHYRMRAGIGAGSRQRVVSVPVRASKRMHGRGDDLSCCLQLHRLREARARNSPCACCICRYSGGATVRPRPIRKAVSISAGPFPSNGNRVPGAHTH